jgi:hypothetical protein
MPVPNDVQTKVNEARNYSNALGAVESGLEVAIYNAVKTATPGLQPGQLPDYGQIVTNAGLQATLRTVIADNYSFDNPINPLYGVINTTNMRRNATNQAMLENLLFPHKRTVEGNIADPRFMDILRTARAQGQQSVVQQKVIGPAAGDVIARNPLNDLKAYLIAGYNDPRNNIISNALAPVAQKEALLKAYGLDIFKKMGANISDQDILDAIQNP